VTLNKAHLQLLVGQTERLIATVLPPTAANKNVVWTCDSPFVATVDQTGLVRAIGGGPANITVTTVDGGFTATCYVLVTVPVSRITITPAAVSIDVGQTYWLMATVEPSNAGNSNVTWSSSSNAIATVNQAGIVTGVARGTVTITAAAVDGSGVRGTAIVNVLEPNVAPTGITLDRSTAVLYSIGSTIKLNATVTPNNATDKTVTWTSSATAVASVDQTGLVRALSSGSTTITARTVNGLTATCIVFVYINSTMNPSNDIIPILPGLPAGIPAGVVSSEPKIFAPRSTDVSFAFNMLTTIMPGFISADFKLNSYGVITLQEWIAKEIAERLLNINNADVIVFPVFEAVVKSSGDVAAIAFQVKGRHLMVDGLISRPENVRLMMALSSVSGDWFTYSATTAGLADKRFTILDMNNNVFTGELVPTADYRVLFLIKDGGAFDLDKKTDATIWGAMAFVGVPVMGVNLVPNYATLLVGQSLDLTPRLVFIPPIADNKRITWTNDSPFVAATVSPSGVVTAIGGGPADIRATTVDGGFWDICRINVTIPVSSVTVTPSTLNLAVNQSQLLSVSILPLNAGNTNVVWSSANTAIATVNVGGSVTAVAPGTVRITATAADGGGARGQCDVTVP
jgi:uncharacterized protein YjdB